MKLPFRVTAVLGLVTLAFIALASSDELPLDQKAINYPNGPVNDAVGTLQQRIDKGDVKLSYEGEFGYLRSVLRALDYRPHRRFSCSRKPASRRR